MNLNKAVFLDRDGVLNEERGDYIQQLSDFKILPFVATELKRLRDAGFKLIVVTNQGGISKGLYTHEILAQMHQFLMEELKKENVVFDEIYYCPHHPDHSKCLCRKPDSILVEKGLAKFNLNAELCFFIGDKQRDIDCASKAGVKGILIEANENWSWVSNKIINETCKKN